VVLSPEEVETIHQNVAKDEGYQLAIDLEQLTVSDSSGFKASFSIDDFRRQCFLKGLDHIALTLQHEKKIAEFEASRVEA